MPNMYITYHLVEIHELMIATPCSSGTKQKDTPTPESAV